MPRYRNLTGIHLRSGKQIIDHTGSSPGSTSQSTKVIIGIDIHIGICIVLEVCSSIYATDITTSDSQLRPIPMVPLCHEDRTYLPVTRLRNHEMLFLPPLHIRSIACLDR